jgi:Cu(I)/Ag(I) efflux system membrane fusion protein
MTPGRHFGIGTLVLATLISSATVGGGVWWLSHLHQDSQAAPAQKAKYQCPMHPTIVQDHPGDCPICGMKLVKVEEAEAGGDPKVTAVPGQTTVDIDPARQQLIGLTTAEVTTGPVGGAWRTVGRVAVDETRVRRINVKVPGFVERIFVDFVGKSVRKGDPLFAIYSPELLSAQEEYLLALRTQASLSKGGALTNDGDVLVKGARRKLALWDVPESEIERLSSTGEPTKTLTFYSPVSGVVTKKDVVEGMKLDAGAMPYEIVDLSRVWVLADVYESELRFIKEGMPATLTLNAFPDREFKGRALFIDPLLDPKTRTVKVRLAFPNPGGELRPEMFGEVILHGKSREGLRLPKDAVVDSGAEKIVFVALGDGKFQPRVVRLGDASGDVVEVVSGLQAGDRVVTRANFLIDSESRLRASLAEMSDQP